MTCPCKDAGLIRIFWLHQDTGGEGGRWGFPQLLSGVSGIPTSNVGRQKVNNKAVLLDREGRNTNLLPCTIYICRCVTRAYSLQLIGRWA